jgi:hypothetical protein
MLKRVIELYFKQTMKGKKKKAFALIKWRNAPELQKNGAYWISHYMVKIEWIMKSLKSQKPQESHN